MFLYKNEMKNIEENKIKNKISMSCGGVVKDSQEYVGSEEEVNRFWAFQPAKAAYVEDVEKMGWAYFKVFCGPAAGPLCICTMGMDIKLRDLTKAGALDSEERWLVGGSMAALRFAALITGTQGSPCTEELQDAFTRMVYHPKMGITAGRQALKGMMDDLFRVAAPRPAEIINHPTWRMAIIVNAVKPWAARLPEWLLLAVFSSFMVINTVTTSIVDLLQKRMCFYTGPNPPPFFECEKDILFLPLTESNIYHVFHATTCIPFLSVHCHHINGLEPGLFYDGAFSDYHLTVKLRNPAWPAVLMGASRMGERLLPTVWDSFLPWRTMKTHLFEHLSMLYFTQDFVNHLSRKTPPMLKDYFTQEFMDRPESRFKVWNEAYALSCSSMPDHPLKAQVVTYEDIPVIHSALGYVKALCTQVFQQLQHMPSIFYIWRLLAAVGSCLHGDEAKQ